MTPIDDDELRDLILEAQHPGKLQKRALSVERRRKFSKAARMLADPTVTFRDYLEAIREIEPREDSSEFVEAVKLWHEYRGRR
jgi:hypothetical protein